MTYYVNYDALEDQIIEYTDQFSPHVALNFIKIDLYKTYGPDDAILTNINGLLRGENKKTAIVKLEDVQSQLKRILRENKLNDLLN